MTLKNVSKKIINIGLLSILPGKTEPLGEGFAAYEQNPVVQFLIKKGDLKVVKDGEVLPPPTDDELELEAAERAYLADRLNTLTGKSPAKNVTLAKLRRMISEAEDAALQEQVQAKVAEAVKEYEAKSVQSAENVTGEKSDDKTSGE